MEIKESRKNEARRFRPSRIDITEDEDRALQRLASRMKNENFMYGDWTLRFKAGHVVHVFFEDSVPVFIRERTAGTASETAEKAPENGSQGETNQQNS